MFKADSQSTETIIGPSVHVEGEFKSQGNIQIDGAVTGTIQTAGALTVGREAKLNANVQAGSAQIAGMVKGNIAVVERLELAPTSRVEGDVSAKVLVVAEGAQINGRCSMGAPAGGNNANGPAGKTKKEKLAPVEA